MSRSVVVRPYVLLRIVVCMALGMGTPAPSRAQSTDLQSWSLATANIALGDASPWFLYLEAQARVGNDISRMERLLLRPAVGRNLTNTVALFLGYAWTPTFTNTDYETEYRDEQRLWQQVVVKHAGGGVAWQHRIRQEQRTIADAGGTSHRTRYLVRASRGPAPGERIGVTGYHELFVTWNTVERGPRAGFDRSRIFVGPFLTSGPLRYEAGYVGEYGRRFGERDRIIHALLVSANFTF